MKNYFILFSLIYFQLTSCQDYGNLVYLNRLPVALEEVSGMEIIEGTELLIAVNDSGNQPVVYIYDFDNGFNELKTDVLKNQDWEDLALYKDLSTNQTLLYIGDFGNNDNHRRDLIIYELDITKITAQDLEIAAVKEFPFSYDNQKEFPPKKKERFYDCEAFIRTGDYFYLFSKNRSKNFNGKTQVYRLKADGISKTAEYLTEIEICNDPNDCLITSADVNSKGDIALLTSDKVFILSNYDAYFQDYDIKRYDLNHYSQKESVVFKKDDVLWISDEQDKKTGRNLYEFKLED